jgi:Sigma-70, region 4
MRVCRSCHELFEPTESQRCRWDWICAACEKRRNEQREEIRKEERSYKESLYALTVREIAEELNESEEAVKSLLKRAYSKIRKGFIEMEETKFTRQSVVVAHNKPLAETYCMERLPNGVICHNRIPLTERICKNCEQRLERDKKGT